MYSTPSATIEAGKKAYKKGIKKEDCPISYRTNANAIHWWNKGWEEESTKTCKGKNCTAVNGEGHSKECIEEHEEAYSGINP